MNLDIFQVNILAQVISDEVYFVAELGKSFGSEINAYRCASRSEERFRGQHQDFHGF
jgi:hypothetical protein